MANVRERWLSRRSIALHVALLIWVPGCVIAAWWQAGRAADGNELSYLYSVMWPVFALLGIFFWWMLIHTDYETVGLKGMRRQQLQSSESDAITAHASDAVATSPAPLPFVSEVSVGSTDDDPELAAYNARLAELATKGANTWRHREDVVVRRPQ